MSKIKNKEIGKVTIELFTKLGDKDYNWGQIQCRQGLFLVGMYETGKIERQLFNMDKIQARQLANTLLMLVDTLEE